MPIDLYEPCPCGSGKKFKWCCQPIHERIDRALQQDEDGQHEAALRIMDEVVRDHAANPEAWGRYAEMLYRNDRVEEAEQKLEKAFQLNKDYAFGHVLRGHFRLYEGELAGALMLFRRATELYDPEAKGILSQVYFQIFDCEMRLNRPVAARMAAEKARNLMPANPELRQGVEAVFGPESPNLIDAARREYRFQAAPSSAGGERRAAWDRALSKAGGKLSEAAAAFDSLVREDENDAPAWYNLGLVRAWEGNNPAAVDALERYVALEQDTAKAEEAWALAEVLLCGQGMEERANFVEHSVTVPLAQPQEFVQYLSALERQGLLYGVRVDQERGVLSALLLEKPGPALTAELEAKQSPRFGASLIMMGNILRLWSPNKEKLQQLFQSMESRIGPGLDQAIWARGPLKFMDVLIEHLIFPRVVEGGQAEATAMLRQHMEREMEEVWIHRPIRNLGNVPPIDAAGHPVLGKKLGGLIRFMEDCVRMVKVPYDMNRLRRKLNLGGGAAEPTAQSQDISAMNTAELAGLDVRGLEPAQLEQGFQAALKLDAREVAGQFAQELVSRPPSADRPDRYSPFSHLVQLALGRGDTAGALDHLNEATRQDCENNAGRRRDEYEFRRAQVHAKAGQFDEAQDVFDRLIARVPDELKFRVGAAEAMLSAKQGTRARALALAGLDAARKQNNRDLEGHFQELARAAEKMG